MLKNIIIIQFRCIIFITDLNPGSLTSDLENLSQVKKYEIDENKYSQMDNTYRNFRKNLQEKRPELFQKKKTH